MRADSDLAQLSLIRAGADRHLPGAPCGWHHSPAASAGGRLSLYLDTWLVMHEDLRHSPACKRVFDFSRPGLQAYIRGPLAS